MKKLIALLLSLSTMFLFGCSAGKQSEEAPKMTEGEKDSTAPLSDGKTLKLLAITSSFGKNTTEFLYDIAVAEGATDVVIGRLYASGCTLQQHVSNAQNDAWVYQYTKNDSGQWVTKESVSMLAGLKDEEWDIIYLQQSAAQAGIKSSYRDYIDTLMAYVQKNKTNPDAHFIWNMNWAYESNSDQTIFASFNNDQMTMYQAIVQATNQFVVPRTDFDAIIPSGTAIQNARTSYFGDHLTKDNHHLNNLGRAIAGYTIWSVVTGQPLTQVNLGKVNSYDLPEYLELSDSDRQVIIESVNNAVKKPFEVTVSVYTTK